MSAADQILQGERPSERRRREIRSRIRRAYREGRIDQALCQQRVQSVSQAHTTADLDDLLRDLGKPEGMYPLTGTAALSGLGLMTVVAAWEPVLLSSLYWIVLALPVTVITPFVIRTLVDFLL